MAQISISISTQHGSEFSISLNATRDVVHVDSCVNIASGYNKPDGTPATQPYDLTSLSFHGSFADLQLFADQLVAAVYPDVESEPDCECRVSGDQADASACEVHGDGK